MDFEVDYDKNPTELYTAICQGEWENAANLAKENPDDARTWVVRHNPEEEGTILWRFLPLHSACARQTSDNLIESLLVAYPEGAAARDDQGFLPFHYACGNRASDAVVNMLLIVYPQAATIQDPYGGKLPLHHLSQWGTFSAGVVNMLLAVHPQGIHCKDFSGYSPLDLAKSANYPGRNVVITALKRCAVASKKRSTEIEKRIYESIPDSFEEVENLKCQLEEIETLKDELAKISQERQDIEVELDNECSLSKETRHEKFSKVSTLTDEVSKLQGEVKSIRNTYHESEKDHAQTLDDIVTNGEEIVRTKKATENMIKERDTLKEKLILKMKTSDDTIKKLEKRVDQQKLDLSEKLDTLSTLEKTAKNLESEIDSMKKENSGMEEEAHELRDAKRTSEKIDIVYATLHKLQVRYDKLKQITSDHDRVFKESVVEREHKILEIAQLEEQLRVRTNDEHENLMNELQEQNEDIKNVVQIVKGTVIC